MYHEISFVTIGIIVFAVLFALVFWFAIGMYRRRKQKKKNPIPICDFFQPRRFP